MNDTWLKFYINGEKYLRRNSIKLATPNGSLPHDELAFRTAAKKITADDQLVKCLLARILTSAPQAWLIDWLDNKLRNKQCPTCTQLLPYRWIAVPTLITLQDAGALIWILVGIKPSTDSHNINFTNIPDSNFAKNAKMQINSIWDSYRQNDKSTLAIWTINALQTDMKNLPVDGRSLGLPFALALTFLDGKKAWPQGLYATGGISENKITAVDGLAAKHLAIPENNKNQKYLFLYPDACADWQKTASSDCIATSNLPQAREYASWFSMDSSIDYHFCHKCLSSDKTFLDNLHELPVPILQHIIENEQHPLRLQTAKDNYQLWLKTVETLNRVRKDNDRSSLLLSIFSGEDISALASCSKNYARLAFTWCKHAIAIENHQGKTKEAKLWYDRALNFTEHADPKEFASLINHYEIISNRHNHYDFRLELPATFQNKMAERLEKYRQVDSDYALGAFYGSVAQNYAFSGPDFLQKTIEAAQKAIRYFSDPIEKKRQYCYMSYACLDALDHKLAWEFIREYLDLNTDQSPADFIRETPLGCEDEFSILPVMDTPYVLALLCRFYADNKEDFGGINLWKSFSNLYKEIICTNKEKHPYQLTLINLGRIARYAGEKKTSRLLWEKSFEICRTNQDSTIQPMGLMAACLLHKYSLLSETALSQTRQLLSDIKKNAKIKHHFRQVFSNTPKEALDMVGNKTRQLFPFTYR